MELTTISFNILESGGGREKILENFHKYYRKMSLNFPQKFFGVCIRRVEEICSKTSRTQSSRRNSLIRVSAPFLCPGTRIDFLIILEFPTFDQPDRDRLSPKIDFWLHALLPQNPALLSSTPPLRNLIFVSEVAEILSCGRLCRSSRRSKNGRPILGSRHERRRYDRHSHASKATYRGGTTRICIGEGGEKKWSLIKKKMKEKNRHSKLVF